LSLVIVDLQAEASRPAVRPATGSAHDLIADNHHTHELAD
jgi:hypothetical protein